MIYKKIEIKNFRGIREFSLDNITRVNLFLGQNNCGKSSILEAILLLSGINNPQFLVYIDNFRNLLHTEENDFRFIFYKLDYNNKLEISADLLELGSSRKLTITPRNDINISQVKPNPEAIMNINTSLETISTNYVDSLNMKGELKRRHASTIFVNSSITFKRDNTGIASLLPTIDKSYKNDFFCIIQNVNQRLGETSKRIENLIIEKQKTSLLTSLKTIDSKIEDISLGRNDMVYFDIGAERLIPASLMGDGIIKYMNIIANLSTVKNGVLLIDEIDNGLHFSSLRKIWEIILTIAKSNNVQLFITTHSKESLIYLKEVLEEKEMSSYRTDVKCYTISKLSDDKIYSYEYDFESFDFALENDLEIRGKI